jgi:uncharacterized protein (DUF952 family)
MSTNWVYKIMTAEQWARLEADGVWSGSEVDLRDGFVHLSAWGQVVGTLEKHFAPQEGLLLVGLPVERVRAELRWEVSRGGQEFPHLYRELRLGDVGNRRPIDWVDGQPRIGEILPRGGQLELGYPLYLLHHGPGYVSLVDVAAETEPQPQALALFSSYEQAAEFVEAMAGFAGIKALRSGRELQWLLASLKQPVVEAVLDPALDRPEIAGVWRRSVRELLEEHVQIDNSPWHYPVYLLRRPVAAEVESGRRAADEGKLGWSSISAGGESQWFLFVALFTEERLAAEYRVATEGEDGWPEVVEVTGRQGLREILVGLGRQIAGVAVNPTVAAGVRKCENCLEIGRLLDHYLAVVPPAGGKI